MPTSLLALLCLAAVSPTSGLRRKAKTNSNLISVEAEDDECAALEDITALGRNVGKAASLLCQFWPANRFGEFPAKDTETVANLVNEGSDLWKKVANLTKGGPGGSTFCWKKAVVRERLPKGSQCAMKNFGRCYGSCPAGMKPMKFVGRFVPTYSSECKSTTLKRSCGLGCASNRRSCIGNLVDQVGVVAKGVGKVASYLTGNDEISEVVDKVLRLVDFFVDTLFEVVGIAKKVYSDWPKEKAQFGAILAILQHALESVEELGQDFKHLNNEFGETLEMVMELLDAEFSWKKIDLEFVTDTVLKHGSKILDAADEFATLFVFPTCTE